MKSSGETIFITAQISSERVKEMLIGASACLERRQDLRTVVVIGSKEAHGLARALDQQHRFGCHSADFVEG